MGVKRAILKWKHHRRAVKGFKPSKSYMGTNTEVLYTRGSYYYTKNISTGKFQRYTGKRKRMFYRGF